MTTEKTHTVPVRLSNELIAYLGEIVEKTTAKNTTEAIRFIITERQLRDDARGEIAQFGYIPAPTKRDRRKKAPSGTSEASKDAPHIGDPQTPPLREKEPTPAGDYRNPFDGLNIRPYPGTREEYERLLKRGEIVEGMFLPPEE